MKTMQKHIKIPLALALIAALALAPLLAAAPAALAAALPTEVTVLAVDPTDSIKAPVSGTIAIYFNTPVNPSSGTVELVKDGGAAKISPSSATINGDKYTAQYSGLEYGTLYRVKISGFAARDDATITMSAVEKTFTTQIQRLNIVTQPISVISAPDANVTFTVKSESSGTREYQWQVKPSGSSSFVDLHLENRETLTLNKVTAAMNGNVYRLVITAKYGGSEADEIKTSSEALLTISSVNISKQPADLTVKAGAKASFTVTAAPAGNVRGYQWYVSQNGGTFTSIYGATSATYTIEAVTRSMDGYQYRCEVIPTAGSAITSAAARLTVLDGAPEISQHPMSVSVNIGSKASFYVYAYGAQPISYQWEISRDNGRTWSAIRGEIYNYYTTAQVDAGMDGELYRVTVSNSSGSDRSIPARLSVSGAARYTVMFMNQGSLFASKTVTGGTSIGSNWPSNPTRPGYTFAGWNTLANGLGTTYTSSSIIYADMALYAVWQSGTQTSSPSATQSPSATSTPSTATDVTNAAAESAGKTAAADAKKAGLKTATAKLKNPAKVTKEGFAAMTKAAGMTVKLIADSLKYGTSTVDVRLTLDPSKAKTDLILAGSTSSSSANFVVGKFVTFKNDKMAVSLSQQGAFGQVVTVAVKLNSNISTKNLVIYSYNRTKNSYSKLATTTKVDTNGYLHFTVSNGGDYLITDGTLRK